VITDLVHRVFFVERGVDATFFSPSAFVTTNLLIKRIISRVPSVMDAHGVPPEGFLAMILDTKDLEEEDWEASDTLPDEVTAHKLFIDLNRGLLGLPGDGKVIITSDSKEEEHADNRANVDTAPSSLRVPLAPSATKHMTHPMRCKMIVVAVGPKMKPTLPRPLW
jgi:hypothetical protein